MSADLDTCRIRRADLRKLVTVSGPSERARTTARIPRLELAALLRELGTYEHAPAVELRPIIEPLRIPEPHPVVELLHYARANVALACLTAAVAGLLLTAPFWW